MLDEFTNSKHFATLFAVNLLLFTTLSVHENISLIDPTPALLKISALDQIEAAAGLMFRKDSVLHPL